MIPISRPFLGDKDGFLSIFVLYFCCVVLILFELLVLKSFNLNSSVVIGKWHIMWSSFVNSVHDDKTLWDWAVRIWLSKALVSSPLAWWVISIEFIWYMSSSDSDVTQPSSSKKTGIISNFNFIFFSFFFFSWLEVWRSPCFCLLLSGPAGDGPEATPLPKLVSL